MKPTIDLSDPRVQLGIKIYTSQMEYALSVPQRVESAVVPVFALIDNHKLPRQVASGVALCIKGRYFLLHASHILDTLKGYPPLIGTGDGNQLIALSGESFSTKKGPSGFHFDDPIDALVSEITSSDLNEYIVKNSIGLQDLDPGIDTNYRNPYIASGFLAKTTKAVGRRADSKRAGLPSVEYGEKEYSSLNIDRNIQIALAYEDLGLMNNAWTPTAKPKGMSGGAIIRIEGVNIDAPFEKSADAKQLLTAITIEQRREKEGKPGVLLGTRVGNHLGLIKRFLPDLLP